MQFLAVDDEPVLLSRCSSLPGSEGGSKTRQAGMQADKDGRRECACVLEGGSKGARGKERNRRPREEDGNALLEQSVTGNKKRAKKKSQRFE